MIQGRGRDWSRLNFYEIQDLPLFLRRFWALKRECSELHDRWKVKKRPKRKGKIECRRAQTLNQIFVRKVQTTSISSSPLNQEQPISRCSKLFYTISRHYFHIESTFSGASVSFVLSHIARYVPSPEENSCIPITHFQCKNNFEHLLIGCSWFKGEEEIEVVWTFMKFKICLYFWGVFGPWRGSVASYTTDERSKNGQKERGRLNVEELKLSIKSSSEKFRRLQSLPLPWIKNNR